MAELFRAAQNFAELMDNAQYAAAGESLAEGCRYKFRGKLITGRDAIIQIYVDNHEAGSKRLDEVRFFSEVEPVDDYSFRLKYRDEIRKGQAWHTHRCEQVITFAGEEIIEIEHVDLPGEMESLAAFFAVGTALGTVPNSAP